MSQSTSEAVGGAKHPKTPPPSHDTGHDEDHGHHAAREYPYVQHHFDSPKQQFEAGKLGIWLFLVTEILFFAGLFCAYTIYRAQHPEVFYWAHFFLDTKLGALNTIVLIFSSLTAAWAVRNAQRGEKRALLLNIVLTIGCACTFMVVKYFEYSHKFHDGLLPGRHFNPTHAVWEVEAFKSKHPESAEAMERLVAIKEGRAADPADVTSREEPGGEAFLGQGETEKKAAVKHAEAVGKLGDAEQRAGLDAQAKKQPVEGEATDTAQTKDAVEGEAKPSPEEGEKTAVGDDQAVPGPAEPKQNIDPTLQEARTNEPMEADPGQPIGEETPGGTSLAREAEVAAVAPDPKAESGEPEKVAAAEGVQPAEGGDAVATPQPAAPKEELSVENRLALAISQLKEETARPLIEAGLINDPSQGPIKLERPERAHVFFSIYFFMTGLHGLHVLIGIGIWVWLLARAVKGQFGPLYFGPIDFAALYWHLVDLIWIYLFPLLYLIH